MSLATLRLKPRTENLFGRFFGFLEVVAFTGYKSRATWLCRCRCGREKEIGAHDLKRGHIISCGCGIPFRVEKPVEQDPAFSCYTGMLDRCHNPQSKHFARYGGRGITVCERWRQGFRYFIEDLGPRPSLSHSLDRYPHNNGNYEPGNVRWALPKQQSRNCRTNKVIEFRGENRTLAEWSEVLGINYQTLKARVKRPGWSVEKAFTHPLIKGRPT